MNLGVSIKRHQVVFFKIVNELANVMRPHKIFSKLMFILLLAPCLKDYLIGTISQLVRNHQSQLVPKKFFKSSVAL